MVFWYKKSSHLKTESQADIEALEDLLDYFDGWEGIEEALQVLKEENELEKSSRIDIPKALRVLTILTALLGIPKEEILADPKKAIEKAKPQAVKVIKEKPFTPLTHYTFKEFADKVQFSGRATSPADVVKGVEERALAHMKEKKLIGEIKDYKLIFTAKEPKEILPGEFSFLVEYSFTK